jgi:hypothetical protein
MKSWKQNRRIYRFTFMWTTGEVCHMVRYCTDLRDAHEWAQTLRDVASVTIEAPRHA